MGTQENKSQSGSFRLANRLKINYSDCWSKQYPAGQDARWERGLCALPLRAVWSPVPEHALPIRCTHRKAVLKWKHTHSLSERTLQRNAWAVAQSTSSRTDNGRGRSATSLYWIHSWGVEKRVKHQNNKKKCQSLPSYSKLMASAKHTFINNTLLFIQKLVVLFQHVVWGRGARTRGSSQSAFNDWS